MSRPRNLAACDAVVSVIARYHEVHGVSPCLAEIAAELGMCTAWVHAIVVWLEQSGRVTSLWVSGRRSPRSLRVVAG